MTCELVEVLNSFGYHPVFLPRTGIKPPEIYIHTKKGGLDRRGPLADYLSVGKKLPKLKCGKLGDIEHTATSQKSLKTATSFLTDALKCIGIISPPKLDLSFASGSKITFSFTGVTNEWIDVTKIDQVIDDLRIGAIPEEQIEEGKLHIAYDYAYAKMLKMQIADRDSLKFDITGAKLQSFINLGVKGEAKAEDETTITFRSLVEQEPAVFAFKAGQLRRENNQWVFYQNEIFGIGINKDEGPPIPYLIERGVVLRVDKN